MIHHITPEQINIGRVENRNESTGSIKRTQTGAKQFGNILAEKLKQPDLKFSSHASKRLEMRGIELSESDLESIRNAVDLAESKGSRDTLVMHDKASFVVSVRNRTVITAIDDIHMKENIVTNIDSAVIARSQED